MTAPGAGTENVLELGPLLFGEPRALIIGGCAVAALIGALVWDAFRRRALIGRANELPVMRAMIASASPARRTLKAVTLVLAAIGIVIALAEPMRRSRTDVDMKGLDLVIALDASKSMQVGDVPPSRLDQARGLVKAVLKATPNDRVAGVAFAGGAAHFPLTNDHDVTAAFLTDFGPSDLPVGSDLGEALRVGMCILRPDVRELECPSLIGTPGEGGKPLPGEDFDRDRRGRRSSMFGDPPSEEDDELDEEDPPVEKGERGRVLMVFTDGTDQPDEAAAQVEIARNLGITVFFVGFGTEVGGEVWDVDEDGNPVRQKFDDAGKPVISKRDDAGMRGLAAASGDERHYLIAPPTGEIDGAPLVKALDTVKRGVITRRIKQARPVFHWFLFPAFMLLVIEALLSTRRRKVAVP